MTERRVTSERRWALIGGGLALACLVATAWPLLSAVGHSLFFVISGEHMRRQADTFSVAEHFLTYPNFFYPRVYDTRGGPGIYGMEAPIVPYAISLALRVFGPEEYVGRWVVLALSSLGFAAMASYLRGLGRFVPWGLLAAVLLSPMTLFYMRQPMPDMPMVALGTLGLALAYRSSTGSRATLAAASGIFALGVLTKYPLIFVYPAFAFAALPAGRPSAAFLRSRGWLLLLPLLALAAWMAWSEHINATYGQGRRYFHSTPSFDQIVTNLKRFELLHTFRRVVLTFGLVWPATPLLVGGVALGLKSDRLRRSAPWHLWLLGSLLLLATFSHKLHNHYYYAVVALPALWYFVALFLAEAWCWLTGVRDYSYPWRVLLFAGLLGALALGTESVPVTLAAAFVAAFAALGYFQPRWLLGPWSRRVRLLLGGLALLSTLVKPLAESQGRFKNRCARLESPAKTKKRRDELRQLAARYTAPSDTVVSIAEHQQEPWPLLAARRHGWADHARHVRRRSLQKPYEAGARWLIMDRLGGKKSRRAIKKLPKSALVKRGRYFELYSLPEVLAHKKFR